MHVHFLGVCGAFMAGLALIARELGHRVTGSDQNVYPPMSRVLARAGIDPITGYDPAQLHPPPDVVVVGNSMTRGNPCVEHILDTGLPHASGPAWLSAHVLAGRHVVAVAGTHGKTTTTAMIAVILDAAGLDPGFLVGGVPRDFDAVARVGRGGPRRLFVIEADEYDTAFFDKRSKFLHYRPRTLVINNLEYDHADIFDDLTAIERQFHHLVRTVPASGCIVSGGPEVERVLAMECWTKVVRLGYGAGGGGLSARALEPDGSRFEVRAADAGRVRRIEVEWKLAGAHNLQNALAALAAARAAGVDLADGAQALGEFDGIARRLEVAGIAGGVTVYDDFAHHPTAIRATVEALRATIEGSGRIVAVLEPRSNTMRRGVHRDTLGPSLAAADEVFALDPGGLEWSLAGALGSRARIRTDVESLVEAIAGLVRPGDRALVMSNGSFDGLHRRLLARLSGEGAA